jgi:hypothetical protein
MQPPSTSELLAAWERGLSQPTTQQALELLAAGWPDVAEEDLARLSIGQRDAYLFALRERCFGSRITAVVACPACAEQLELAFDLADIRIGPAIGDPWPSGPLEVRVAGYRVSFRLPDSRDLLAGTLEQDQDGTRERLLERCLLSAVYQGGPASTASLPSKVVERIEARMSEVDPQADVRLALACPACDHTWEAPFDIGAFLLREVDAWAREILSEVHVLASAYGWREADVLLLSPRRRRFYLEAVAR